MTDGLHGRQEGREQGHEDAGQEAGRRRPRPETGGRAAPIPGGRGRPPPDEGVPPRTRTRGGTAPMSRHESREGRALRWSLADLKPFRRALREADPEVVGDLVRGAGRGWLDAVLADLAGDP